MKRILIVVDMQKDFVDGSLGSSEAVSIVPKVCKKIENFDGEIFVTMDTHQSNYLTTWEGINLPVVHCIENTEGYQLDANVKKALSGKKYTVFKKNGFGSNQLMQSIVNLGDEQPQVEIIGLCTDVCVVTCALMLRATLPNARITVYSDCCSGVTKEGHNHALETMKCCQIEIK